MGTSAQITLDQGRSGQISDTGLTTKPPADTGNSRTLGLISDPLHTREVAGDRAPIK